MTVYEQLYRLAAHHAPAGYLSAYRDDLVIHDRRALEGAKPGDRYVWALRECGTELFQVAWGREPIWLTYWLDAGNSSRVPTLCWLVTVGTDGGGSVQRINHDRARRLADEPHPQGRRLVFQGIGSPFREVWPTGARP